MFHAFPEEGVRYETPADFRQFASLFASGAAWTRVEERRRARRAVGRMERGEVENMVESGEWDGEEKRNDEEREEKRHSCRTTPGPMTSGYPRAQDSLFTSVLLQNVQLT